MLTDPETGDLILVGGGNLNSDGHLGTNSLFRLSDINELWVLQNQTLSMKRHDHTSMFLPDHLLPDEIYPLR